MTLVDTTHKRLHVVCGTCNAQWLKIVQTDEQLSAVMDEHEGHKDCFIYDWEPEMRFGMVAA